MDGTWDAHYTTLHHTTGNCNINNAEEGQGRLVGHVLKSSQVLRKMWKGGLVVVLVPDIPTV